MAQPDGPQSEPPPTAGHRLFRRLFGSRHQNGVSSNTPVELPNDPLGDDADPVDNVKPTSHRNGYGSVVPGLPRAQTFKRQQSESRIHLAPVEPSIDEKRAVSMDRRSHNFRAPAPIQPLDDLLPTNPDTSEDSDQQPPSLHVPTLPSENGTEEDPLHDQMFTGGAVGGDAANTPEAFSDALSISDSEYEASIHRELETKWILNLSMHFKDHSRREKFFVTYRESEHVWRRVTISLDYRYATEQSLEMDLINTKYQRDKNRKIYEAIRNSLPDIHFFDTVTNLKLETTDGRLHVHVVEDGNEIIPYPPVSQVAHLGCRRIRESEVMFNSHMSGFVYKVRVGGEVLIKKEIPSPDTIEEFLYEINALNSLSYSNNVIKFHGVVVDEYDEHVRGLLISYADGGALIDVIYDNCKEGGHGLDWGLRERWARQIVHGLADIHESGFVQGDFTLSNIVIDHHDNAKIIDINRRGCPVGWEPPEATALIESNHRISMYIGVKSDLYQLGMVLWALAMEEDEPDTERRPLFIPPDANIPGWYRHLTETCLNPDPRKRLQASLLLGMFPPEVHQEQDLPVDDGLSTGAYSDYGYEIDGHLLGSSKWSHFSNPYMASGPPVHESWNYAPRGRSPPSPLPSNFDKSESPRGVYSPTAWAANRYIRSSYSDAGGDEMPDDFIQPLTPTPTADRLVFPEGALSLDQEDSHGVTQENANDGPIPTEQAAPSIEPVLAESEWLAQVPPLDGLQIKSEAIHPGPRQDTDTIVVPGEVNAVVSNEPLAEGDEKEAQDDGALKEISPNIARVNEIQKVDEEPFHTSEPVSASEKDLDNPEGEMDVIKGLPAEDTPIGPVEQILAEDVNVSDDTKDTETVIATEPKFSQPADPVEQLSVEATAIPDDATLKTEDSEPSHSQEPAVEPIAQEVVQAVDETSVDVKAIPDDSSPRTENEMAEEPSIDFGPKEEAEVAHEGPVGECDFPKDNDPTLQIEAVQEPKENVDSKEMAEGTTETSVENTIKPEDSVPAKEAESMDQPELECSPAGAAEEMDANQEGTVESTTTDKKVETTRETVPEADQIIESLGNTSDDLPPNVEPMSMEAGKRTEQSVIKDEVTDGDSASGTVDEQNLSKNDGKDSDSTPDVALDTAQDKSTGAPEHLGEDEKLSAPEDELTDINMPPAVKEGNMPDVKVEEVVEKDKPIERDQNDLVNQQEELEAEQITSDMAGTTEPEEQSNKEMNPPPSTVPEGLPVDIEKSEPEPTTAGLESDIEGDKNETDLQPPLCARSPATKEPDSLAGIGKGLSDLETVPEKEFIYEDDYHVIARPEAVST